MKSPALSAAQLFAVVCTIAYDTECTILVKHHSMPDSDRLERRTGDYRAVLAIWTSPLVSDRVRKAVRKEHRCTTCADLLDLAAKMAHAKLATIHAGAEEFSRSQPPRQASARF